MSDYTQVNNYTTKDGLTTGDPNKLIKGSDMDAEFSAISTAIGTKYDVNDIASQAVAEAGTDNSTVMSPLRTEQHVQAWADENAGMVGDINDLTDPGADTLLGWDDSAGAAINYTLGEGIATAGTSVKLDIGSVTQDTPVAADYVAFYDASGNDTNSCTMTVLSTVIDHDTTANYDANDHIDHTTVSITAGTGLSGGGTIASSRTINLDISGLTNMAVAGTSPTDSIVLNDGGVMKQIDVQDMGIRVVTSTGAQTFALADGNTLQLLTGASAATWTIPANASVAFGIGTCIYVGSRDTATLTISPTAGVTLTSKNNSATADQTTLAGGLAVLIKVGTDEWMFSGDIG